MLTENCVKQVKWNQLIKTASVKEFLSHRTFQVRNGNLLKSRVSEIRVKRIRVNQGVGVVHIDKELAFGLFEVTLIISFMYCT